MRKHFFAKLKSRYTVFVFDMAMVIFAWIGAYSLRFNLLEIPPGYLFRALSYLPTLLAVQLIVYFAFGLYRGDWRFASMLDLSRIIKAAIAGSLISFGFIDLFFQLDGVPRSIFPLYCFLLVGLLGGARFSYRSFRERSALRNQGMRVLVIGAGMAGESLVRSLQQEISNKYNPVAIVDDQPNKQGRDIHGVRVVGICDDIPDVIQSQQIELAIIAISALDAERLRKIVYLCEQSGIPFRRTPSMDDLTAGRVSITALRSVMIEDLLGRSEIKCDWQLIAESVANKKVLITGGGGSIGAEIVRQVANLNPQSLIIIENNEFNLYAIEKEILDKYPTMKLYCSLADVSDECAIDAIFSANQPQTVFHAAAYKHVPILEYQVRTAMKNNILGTMNVAKQAIAHHVKQFILISTDKVVNPSNVMGATKRAAEMICQHYNNQLDTRFITVRFGNVLGSTGSVIPLFRQQIEAGGPVTVTDPNVSRYFMTIPEAVHLILQATVMGQGGEIFVLDMGEPIKIIDLAKQMIMLAGKVPDQDIHIKYTGLRPGEKMHEVLFHDSEHAVRTDHQHIFHAPSRDIDWLYFTELCLGLTDLINQVDHNTLREHLTKMVPEYTAAPQKFLETTT